MNTVVERRLNDAIAKARISERFEEYLEIFDRFYAHDVEVSAEGQEEFLRGRDRIRSLLLNFLLPLHVLAEIGGLEMTLHHMSVPGDVAAETNSWWELVLVGVSGHACTLSWSTLRRWKNARVIFERVYQIERTGEPLTIDDVHLEPDRELCL